MEDNLGRSNSMDLQADEAKYYSSKVNTKKRKGRECCMCGDVGFQERLFRCHRCNNRFQHIYCSRLYSDQFELDGISVCDWCLDVQAKERASYQRKNLLHEMGNRKAKVVAASEVVSRSASTNVMKQPASVTIEKPSKNNVKPTLKLHVKFGGSKQDQLNQAALTGNKLPTESCEKLARSLSQSSSTKSGLGRRFKLLSDVLSR